MEPLLSVIVPVYNVKKYLKKCIDSIIEQTYQHLQIILIDDGSTDGSGEICDQYAAKESRITVIHQKNGGQSRARNSGMLMATGEYVAFVDSDDYLAKNTYSDMVSIAESNHVDVVRFGFRTVTEGETTPEFEGEMEYTQLSCNDFLKGLLSGRTRLMVWCAIYKRELVSDVFFEQDVIYEDAIWQRVLFFRPHTEILSTGKYYRYLVNRPGNTNSVRFVAHKRLPVVQVFIDWIDQLEREGYDKQTVQSFKAYCMVFLADMYQLVYRSSSRDKQAMQQIKQAFRRIAADIDWGILKESGRLSVALQFTISPELYCMKNRIRELEGALKNRIVGKDAK